MAYEKQGFKDGQILTAAHLNHMEQGITEAGEPSVFIVNTVGDDQTPDSDTGWYDIDKTPEEILAAYEANIPIMLYHSDNDGVTWWIFHLSVCNANTCAFTWNVGTTVRYAAINMTEGFAGIGRETDVQTALPAGAEGQVLTVDAEGNLVWAEPTGGDSLPAGGTAGQVLTIAEDGTVVWADPSGSSVASAEGVAF